MNVRSRRGRHDPKSATRRCHEAVGRRRPPANASLLSTCLERAISGSMNASSTGSRRPRSDRSTTSDPARAPPECGGERDRRFQVRDRALRPPRCQQRQARRFSAVHSSAGSPIERAIETPCPASHSTVSPLVAPGRAPADEQAAARAGGRLARKPLVTRRHGSIMKARAAAPYRTHQGAMTPSRLAPPHPYQPPLNEAFLKKSLCRLLAAAALSDVADRSLDVDHRFDQASFGMHRREVRER